MAVQGMLTRVRGALLPRDLLYRRESGAGRRVVIVAKLVGGGIVVLPYVLTPLEPIPAMVAAWAVLSLVALVLGTLSVCSEVSGHTAEALVMTPLDRNRIILSKLGGSAEMLVVFALLLPLHLFSAIFTPETDAFVAGGLSRLICAAEWPHDGQTLSGICVGLGGFASDLAWYVLFASCGIAAAVGCRGRAASWLYGPLLALGLLAVFTLYEGMICGLLEMAYALPVLHAAGPLRNGNLGLLSRVFILASVGVRAWAAWRLLRFAADNFERIATD